MANAIIDERCQAPLVDDCGVAFDRTLGDSVRRETEGRPLTMMLDFPAPGQRIWS